MNLSTTPDLNTADLRARIQAAKAEYDAPFETPFETTDTWQSRNAKPCCDECAEHAKRVAEDNEAFEKAQAKADE